MDIRHGIDQAVHAAAQLSRSTQTHSIAQRRSRMFVYRLANFFRALYSGQPNVATFTRSASWNQSLFGVREFLFDISVLEYDSVPSAHRSLPVPFVKTGLWLAESEFEFNSRAILHDLGKLKISDGDNKLFIASRFHDISGQLDMLAQAADGMRGRLFLALLSEPLQWQPAANPIDSFRYVGHHWAQDSLTAC